jgi:hypothetical protein
VWFSLGVAAAAIVAVGLAGMALAPSLAAQRRGGVFVPPNPPYDGRFLFCRVMYRAGFGGDGGGWGVDSPACRTR